MRDFDELYGYMWLKPNDTGIGVDIFVDDGKAYIRDNHIPLVYIRNGVGREVDEFIPVSISEKPTIIDSSIKLNLDLFTMGKIFNFIKNNVNALLDFADNKIDINTFFEIIN